MHILQSRGIHEEMPKGHASYREFLRVETMSCGLYSIPAGAHDPQVPHNEDEVYCIISGEGRIHVGMEDEPVRPGTIVFVAKGMEHRFHSVTSDLTVLVVFSPPETPVGEA